MSGTSLASNAAVEKESTMNRLTRTGSSVTAALLMMSSLLFAQAEVGPSANGHGNLTIAGGLQTLSFHAREFRDGTVTGSTVAKSRAQNVRIFADLDCLFVVGNTAVLSGVVTQSDNPLFPVGRGAIFRVVDNGEGANDPVDMMTDVIIFAVPSALRCQTNFSAPLMPVEEGNIQVRATLFSLLP
jgi:hypothetical protein